MSEQGPRERDPFKTVRLPPAETIFAALQAHEEPKLIGVLPGADHHYRELTDAFGQMEVSGRQLVLLFRLGFGPERRLENPDPSAIDFVFSHFDEFIDAAVPDPEVAGEAKSFMRKLQQVEMGDSLLTWPLSKN